jgi:hypothetical protein
MSTDTPKAAPSRQERKAAAHDGLSRARRLAQELEREIREAEAILYELDEFEGGVAFHMAHTVADLSTQLYRQRARVWQAP